MRILLVACAFLIVSGAKGQDFREVGFPDGTTAEVVNGKWVVTPPSIQEQETEIQKEEEETESKLGRLYHIHFIFDGNKRVKTAGSLQEAVEEVSVLNRKHSTTGYYVMVGTRY